MKPFAASRHRQPISGKLLSPLVVSFWTLGALSAYTSQAVAADLTPQQRLTHLTALRTKMQALPGTSTATDTQTMLTYLKSNTRAFVNPGIRGTSVYARWIDGPMIVLNVQPTITTVPVGTVVPTAALTASQTSEPDQSTLAADEAIDEESDFSTRYSGSTQELLAGQTRAAVTATAAEMPASNQARVLCTFPSTDNYTDQIKATLRGPRFNYRLASSSASVRDLRFVQGDGLFYIDAHAGTALVGTTEVAFVQTSTPVTLTSLGEPVENADLKAMRTVAMISKEEVRDTNGKVLQKRIYSNYGIGPGFITFYKWRFARNSFVWVNACASYNDALRAAFATAGASVYGGWTKSVRNGRAIDAGHFLLDRLLGANELRGVRFYTESPPQRAFNLGALIPHLATKGLDTDTTEEGAAKLLFESNPAAGQFGLLAPSIKRVQVDELKDHLILEGLFGSDPGTLGRVEVNGTVLPRISGGWTPQRITCLIPRSGPGSSGPVKVVVRAHQSNIVPLTEWEGSILYTLQGLGTLRANYTMSLRYRFDIHSYRDKPGEVPHGLAQELDRYVGLTRLNSAGSPLLGSFVASGSGTMPEDTCAMTLSWNGRATLKNGAFIPDMTTFVPFFGASGIFNSQTRRVQIRPIGSALYNLLIKEEEPCDTSQAINAVGSATHSYFTPPPVDVYFDSNWNIPGKTVSYKVPHPVAGQFPQATVTWKWNTLPAKFAPPPAPIPREYGS